MCKRCGKSSPKPVCPPPCSPPQQFQHEYPQNYQQQYSQEYQQQSPQEYHQEYQQQYAQEQQYQEQYPSQNRDYIQQLCSSMRPSNKPCPPRPCPPRPCPPRPCPKPPVQKPCPPKKPSKLCKPRKKPCPPSPCPSQVSPSPSCQALCPLPPCPMPPNPPKPCLPPVCPPPKQCFNLPATQPCTSCCLVKPCSKDPCDHCPPQCSNPCDPPCLPPCPPREICCPEQRCYFARNCCCGAYLSKYISGTTPDTAILDALDGVTDIMGYLEECADDPDYYKNCLFQEVCLDEKERKRLMKECRKRVECAPICLSPPDKCTPPC